MRSNARSYNEIREYLEKIPLVDCHDHSSQLGPKPVDPAGAVIDWYMRSDLHSASSDRDVALIWDLEKPLEERWPALERAWNRSRFTGYAQVVLRGMKRYYNEDALTLDALKRIAERMIDFSQAENVERVLDDAGILVRLEDLFNLPIEPSEVPRSRAIISLPNFHAICNFNDVQTQGHGAEHVITSLDEYIARVWDLFQQAAKAGAVAFKDQSAYSRSLDFTNPTKAEAEKAFNWMMADPRRRLSYPDGNQPLGDYLFHTFMRFARDLDLPVQIHTGHMAGIRNEIRKTNAALLTSLIELHRDTRFDLFHANWPYSGELLFLAKNYPNVRIDFCWTNMVDPIYTQMMFKQAISSVPHAKIHGYGTDLDSQALTSAFGHAELARDNVAVALSDLVEAEYIGLDDAREIGWAWLFGNANEFFKLGLEAHKPR